MINRLPKEYVPTSTAGSRRTEVGFDENAGAADSLSKRFVAAAGNSVGSHPLISLGAALAAGIFLGKLVKR
jgi:ElaB/YqjD/DUF883 family membrane-anchored ribosome-binding protein